jgi:hypothetical protein
MRKIEPRHIHPRADDLAQGIVTLAGWANGANYFCAHDLLLLGANKRQGIASRDDWRANKFFYRFCM